MPHQLLLIIRIDSKISLQIEKKERKPPKYQHSADMMTHHLTVKAIFSDLVKFQDNAVSCWQVSAWVLKLTELKKLDATRMPMVVGK